MTLREARQVIQEWRDDDRDLPIPSNAFGDELSEAIAVLLEATS